MIFAFLAMAMAKQVAAAPELTKAQANAMTAERLAEMLLPAGHPEIKSVKVHPWGMEANFPYVTEIEFFSTPELANDLCRQQVFRVPFEPTQPVRPPLPDGADLAARPTGIKEYTQIRLADLDSPVPARCSSSEERFFELSTNASSEKVDVVRQFYQIIRNARSGHGLPFKLTFSDELSRDLNGRGGRVRVPPIRRKLDALKAFPIFGVCCVDTDPDPRYDDFSLVRGYPRTGDTRWVQVSGVAGYGSWEADLVLRGNTIVRVHIRRTMIPPA